MGIFMKLTELFIDDSGKLSSSRILIYIISLSYLVFIGYVTYKTVSVIDLPLQVAGLVALIYGLNKFSPTYEYKNNDENK